MENFKTLPHDITGITPGFQKPCVVANWKMQGSRQTVARFLSALEEGEGRAIAVKVEIIFCPPALYLQGAVDQVLFPVQSPEKLQRLRSDSNSTGSENKFGGKIKLGAQNVYCEPSGPFTGEIAPEMLLDCGCQYVIIGHSERRQLFFEDDALIARKFLAAYHSGLIPILCVGETREERVAGQTLEVVRRQLGAVFEKMRNSEIQNSEIQDPEIRNSEIQASEIQASEIRNSENQNFGIPGSEFLADFSSKAIIAYEPVWAIGTGLTASPEQAEAVHAFIREWLGLQGVRAVEKLRILYGGSVKAENAKALFAEPNINGALVGNASLKADEFLAICQAASASR